MMEGAVQKRCDIGINRNIVECKCDTLPEMKNNDQRINRNIVECKFFTGFCFFPNLFTVLIETLWNVNLNAESDRAEAPAGINRNIVECKFFLRWYLARSSRVLIETLWNVNVE